MRTTLLLIFIGVPFCLFSQTQHGFSYDNYSGIYGAISNPANAVESKHKFHINGLSYNRLGASDFGAIDLLTIEQNPNGFNGIEYPEDVPTPSQNNTMVSNSDVLLPSVLWNFHPKHAAGILVRSRNFSDYNGFNGQLWKDVENGFQEGLQENSFTDTDINFNNTTHSWNEVGLNYAAVLVNANYHFVKFGGTFKLLMGNGGTEFRGANVSGNYDASGTGDLTLQSGEIVYLKTNQETSDTAGQPANFLNSTFSNFETDNLGFGGDVGLVYEWRPRETNNVGVRNNAGAVNTYKLRLSAAILDMGTITYTKEDKNIFENTLRVVPTDNVSIPKSEIADRGFINSLISSGADNNIQQGSVTFALPRSLNIGLDYILFNDKNYYINLNYVMPLTDVAEEYANTRTEMITLTPRYETRKLSVYLPLSFGVDTGFFAGAGVRFGPVTLGTAALTGMLTEGNVRHVYFGLNLPLLEEIFR